MRRPLCLAALFLVIIAALRLKAGWADDGPPGFIGAQLLDTADELLVTGQVYQKDETSIYLKSVVIYESEALGLSTAGSRQEIQCQDNFICELEQPEVIPLGAIVAVRGEFSPYTHATNPGEFDSAVYYRTLKIGGKLKKAVLLAAGEDHWPVREALYRLKGYLKARLYRIFPEKEAAVMSALLLGDKKDLDRELKDLYQRNGILHILSISSLHITIIGMSVYRLLRKIGLPICPAALAGSVLLLLYGCMTGFSVSACRAIGMYLIKMLGEMAGRTYDMLTGLGVMAAVMAAGNPYYLQNSGFLLSFASVLGIGVVCPALAPELSRGMGDGNGREQPSGEKGRLRVIASVGFWKERAGGIGRTLLQSAFASLSITLATLPVQLWFYYEIPVYSVFLNLFVLPLMKPMMITGLLALLVPGLGILGSVDYVILKSYEFLCGCFDGLPFHTWNPGCPQVWQIVAYYILLTAVVALGNYLKKRERRAGDGKTQHREAQGGKERSGRVRDRETQSGRTQDRKAQDGKTYGAVKGYAASGRSIGTAAKLCMLSAAVILIALRPPAVNSVTFLDVGQGDCILVRTGSGENYLFDCGSSSRRNVGKYVVIPYLKYMGIRNIDAVFLSHPDADHVNGALELFATGEENHLFIGQILLPAIREDARIEQLGELIEAAGMAQGGAIPLGFLGAGESWSCGSAVFTCVHPSGNLGTEDVNAYSECFYVEFSEKPAAGGGKAAETDWTMLLTGDVQNEGEAALQEELERRDIRGITLLKAAHHGSKNSTPAKLLERLVPTLTVISSGRDNRYGHPHAELLERLEDSGTVIVQTALYGAVTVTFENGVRVSSFSGYPACLP